MLYFLASENAAFVTGQVIGGKRRDGDLKLLKNQFGMGNLKIGAGR